MSLTWRREMLKRPLYSARPTDSKAEVFLHVSNIRDGAHRNMFKVSVKQVNTVSQLKDVISSQHGHAVTALSYRGVPLADEHKMAHLIPDLQHMGAPRFSARTKPHTHPKPGEMSVYVNGLEGALFQLHLPAQSTVAELTTAILNYEAYPSVEELDITCAGKSLSALDPNLALDKCNVVAGCVVKVAGKLVGGNTRFPVRVYFDMDPMPDQWVIDLVDYKPGDPTWRVVRPGLSVTGRCQNRSCAAFEQTVYCGKGFVVFNIAEVVHCPACKSVLTASSIGFRKCRWLFEGRKVGFRAMDRMSKWVTTSGEKEFEYFDVDKGQNLAEVWSLVIIAKPLPSNRKSEINTNECADCYHMEPSFWYSEYVEMPCGHRVHPSCKRKTEDEGYNVCRACLDPEAP